MTRGNTLMQRRRGQRAPASLPIVEHATLRIDRGERGASGFLNNGEASA